MKTAEKGGAVVGSLGTLCVLHMQHGRRDAAFPVVYKIGACVYISQCLYKACTKSPVRGVA